ATPINRAMTEASLLRVILKSSGRFCRIPRLEFRRVPNCLRRADIPVGGSRASLSATACDRRLAFNQLDCDLRNWELFRGEFLINLAPLATLDRDLSFRLRIIEMCNSFRDGEETMHVISVRKHLARQFPGSRSVFRHQLKHCFLTLAYRAEITIKQLFVVVNRFAMT